MIKVEEISYILKTLFPAWQCKHQHLELRVIVRKWTVGNFQDQLNDLLLILSIMTLQANKHAQNHFENHFLKIQWQLVRWAPRFYSQWFVSWAPRFYSQRFVSWASPLDWSNVFQLASSQGIGITTRSNPWEFIHSIKTTIFYPFILIYAMLVVYYIYERCEFPNWVSTKILYLISRSLTKITD